MKTPSVQVRLLDPRLSDWGFPHYGSDLAAGLDLHACLDDPLTILPGAPAVLVSSGLSVHIAQAGWCGLVVPRSGLGHRGLVLGNTLGVIDADYEGPVLISAWNRNRPIAGTDPGHNSIVVRPGERIAQLLFVEVARPHFEVVDAFRPAARGARGSGGFGSSGLVPATGQRNAGEPPA